MQWSDAYFFGSQGFALVNELERAGFDVGMYEPWHVPVTQHRVIPYDQATAELVMATGGFVDQWRADDRVVEVASYDPRTDAEREQFAALRDDLIADLEANGLDDLVPIVDTNLFGVRVDPRLSQQAREDAARLLILGQETAVFIGPPGVRRDGRVATDRRPAARARPCRSTTGCDGGDGRSSRPRPAS